MRITLNRDLKPYTLREQRIDVPHFAQYALKVQGTLISADLPETTENLQEGLIGVLAEAYRAHRPVRLAPHDVWFLVLTQLAAQIKANADRCRPLFTNSDTSIDIAVPTDDVTTIDPRLLMEKLRDLVPSNVDAFLPVLTTADDTVKIAMCAAFADAVQVYYTYSTFMCGIPELDISGTTEDWNKLLRCTAEIAGLFSSIGLKDVVRYLIRVGDLLNTIVGQLRSVEQGDAPDIEFWKGIFTSKNVGSGAQLLITGWITDLFFKKPDYPLIENFTGARASFPYTNRETGRRFMAYHGAFSRCVAGDGTIYAGYGCFISELSRKEA